MQPPQSPSSAQQIKLGHRAVGPGVPCYVIAEAGANHNRDLDTARRLIDAAADACADAIKFQTYSGTSLYSTKAPHFDYLADLSTERPHELLERISLPRDWQPILADHARDRGIHFLSSPFDRQAVDELDALDVPAFKVASFEIVDLPFVEYVASKGRPVILSTGMSTLAEIDEAVRTCTSAGTEQVALLQCASLYPAPPNIMNLRSIRTMQAAFGRPVGLSDHTIGVHIAAAAVALGASLIEKHFTLDRALPGPDHPFAVEPGELADLVRNVRDTEAALGDGVKRGPSAEERDEMYAKARRSVIAACKIPAGARITRDMLTVKRPGFGIQPRFLEALVGRTASRDIDHDDVITWEML